MEAQAEETQRPARRLFRRLRGLFGRRSVRRTPTILQMEAVECGAASLAMILAHHGVWIPLERLRVACGVSRDGSKAANVLIAARRFGFTARGFRSEPAGVPTLPMPCIIHWNFNHFVVLEGIRRGHAFINDPAMGRRQIDMAELDLAFTGVVLTFEPNEEFKKMGRKVASAAHPASRAARLEARGQPAGGGEPDARRSGNS